MAASPELKVAALAEWERLAAGGAAVSRPRPGARSLVALVLSSLLKLLVIVALPFVVLVRAAVFFHYRQGGWSSWFALAAGALLTVLVVTAYAAWLSRKLTGKARVQLVAKWVAVPLVTCYCGYALLYLSRVHAKGEAVRAYYTSLHPVLRLALSTVILADGGIVITDLRRRPEDYARMGLPVNNETLHYPQRDGWVHAVDLRTAGRSVVQNRLIDLYFRAMGFGTLRHVGTADHLHVSLPLTTLR